MEITLTDGSSALIDDEDWGKVRLYNWYPHTNGYATGYRRGTPRNSKVLTVMLHHLVMDRQPGQEIDHKNGNKRDCRKENLRFASRSQNQANKGARKDSRSGFRGVSPARNSWRARIIINGKRKYLGIFKTAEHAARVYDTAAVTVFGEFAKTNFPKVDR